MAFRARVISSISIAVILLFGGQSLAETQLTDSDLAPMRAVREFYAFHLARNKDFTVRNLQLRKRWLTPVLYKLMLDELKSQAKARRTHPDEAPYFEGDPLTDSQEYPSWFRVGGSELNVEGDLIKVTVTLLWSVRSSRGSDQRDIVVELKKRGAKWLINDIINNQGSRLSDELKRAR